ncbi:MULTISPECIES: transposase [unclassified Streptomyces]|uniref:transposase n=1 Tax=unclassified Streptomyces TaxID=2593676 RepID=UPI0038682DB2
MLDHGRVIHRHELSDAEWEFVRPLLPRSERGRKRLDDRTVLNGIIWKFRTGAAWRDAGRTRSVRILGHAAHSLPPMGQGRHRRADAVGSPGAGGCGR